jgi:nicotinate-nucleotide adenylyltransferase
VRLGLFGGTFDPPHVGHLLAASDAFEALSLDRLVFIPNARQPLKTGVVPTDAPHRLEMARLTCQDDPRFAVDSIEIDRGGLSFTVDTVREYRKRHPDAALFLLVGEDIIPTLPSWRESAALLEMIELVVLTRGTSQTESGPGRRLETRRVDISSTEIRDRVRRGMSVTGFVTDGVAEYIAVNGLYGG